MHDGQQLVQIERLGEPPRSARGFAGTLFFGLGFAGQHDNRHKAVTRILPDFLNQADAINTRHIQISYKSVNGVTAKFSQSISTINSLNDLVSSRNQGRLQYFAHGGRIVYCHDTFSHNFTD